ncbi:hypothetical protein OIU14_02445 [Thalassobacter stenotrophicus]|uniref:DUF6680 family protein n=1 Tax=Thalassobacter stenotrophicus TaxID=266809 RepID=UPI0022A98205|nr:DUF6680 family protein [Thalassobacter stenotrophicus]UYP68614.1 hypothetical protein OIU14_02445 [Thalassobacter stenotrophicus]
MSLSLEAILTILAVLLSPLLAVQITKFLEKRGEKRARRVKIYRALMATRTQRLSPAHIEALNSIDLEFTDRGDKAVKEAWKALLAHLSDTSYPKDQNTQWALKHVDLLVELLFDMGNRLGYQFDKTHLKIAVYSPKAYGDLEEDQMMIRKGVRDLLEGRASIPVKIQQELDGE